MQLSLFEDVTKTHYSPIRPVYATCTKLYHGEICRGQCPSCAIIDGYHPPSVEMKLNPDSWLCHDWLHIVPSCWNEGVFYIQDKDGFTVRKH